MSDTKFYIVEHMGRTSFEIDLPGGIELHFILASDDAERLEQSIRVAREEAMGDQPAPKPPTTLAETMAQSLERTAAALRAPLVAIETDKPPLVMAESESVLPQRSTLGQRLFDDLCKANRFAAAQFKEGIK